ncbi:MAG: hypothetical protein LBG05_05630 [Treponema sp.]|jgi:hypothetical protein|nr:hypothetical protein [Treponema sp.]
MKKTWLFLAYVLCSALTLFAQDAAQNAGDFQTITGYKGSAADVRIPDRIHGAPVTSIGAEAFGSDVKIIRR